MMTDAVPAPTVWCVPGPSDANLRKYSPERTSSKINDPGTMFDVWNNLLEHRIALNVRTKRRKLADSSRLAEGFKLFQILIDGIDGLVDVVELVLERATEVTVDKLHSKRTKGGKVLMIGWSRDLPECTAEVYGAPCCRGNLAWSHGWAPNMRLEQRTADNPPVPEKFSKI